MPSFSRLAALAVVLVLVDSPLQAAPAPKKAAAKKPALVKGTGATVTLNTGTLVHGIYHGEADGAIWVEVDGGEVGIERDTIVSIVAAKTPDVEMKERRAALGPKDTAGWWEFSQWATKKELNGAAESAARTVIKLDPDHAGARELLGYEKVKGSWLKGEDIYLAQGLVQFERRWVTPDEATALKQAREKMEKEDNLRAMRRPAPAVYQQPEKKRPLSGWVDYNRGGQ